MCHTLQSLTLWVKHWSVTYWREAGEEVDFVISHGAQTWALEVKAGAKIAPVGSKPFASVTRKQKSGWWARAAFRLEEFFSRPAMEWFT